MNSEIDSTKEEKLKSLLGQLEVECGIFERIVYKNKNQHRRSSYFQYLLKVRRDLRLLKSANLEELISSCFLVITGIRPKQKVQLLESLKRRKNDVGKPNFMDRLLGAARLLSQIVEPMLRAATEISTLVARSFFMGFSLTVLALLARLRVLVQQILLDMVPVFNTASSLSQKKQSIKITHQGIEVYREFFPKKEDFVTLECVWNMDKFVLVERTNRCEIEMQERGNDGEVSAGGNAVQYETIESFLGDDEPTAEKADAETSPCMKVSITGITIDHDDDKMQVENVAEKVDGTVFVENSELKNVSQAHLVADTSTSAISDSFEVMSNARKVAFVSVKRPASSPANPTDLPLRAGPSTMNPTDLPSKGSGSSGGDKTDAFYSLLTLGNLNNSLFE
ncbi:hypothetical protein ERO13_D01G064500v2 [Gossypium hirsutum]|uniref:Nucleolus and neural progenitor protein-like N-terminal domain-containing protein n=5 Tax=Gossypium TaxID=3633 RepID=A0A1U8MKI8_GOSHI|nr:uncharacterized protein LOC107938624 [Gossypium hirsutum]KAB2044294.1 hypothetical protein ES319_D01G079300v1 [Gossypium barbadense]TYG82440.1 hypothetical protein ES288_D01G088300v1 [Gossypium darwinii]TYH87011.1 hypothetical protein ES332_D01G085200v1 [Gossypium tomentosum]TYI96608.1 hypothetical protein E1A91_D01G084800v1 [Gossypium mustelinum]KAG4161575.1 hypothetical protein ERO13_D01G064500v2 [Gossypium hirsutum]